MSKLDLAIRDLCCEQKWGNAILVYTVSMYLMSITLSLLIEMYW